MLYELLIGKRPFTGHSAVVMAHHIMTPPRPLREQRSSLSPMIEKICLKALEKDPEDRYRSAKEFADALGECQKLPTHEGPEPLPNPNNVPDWVASSVPVTDMPITGNLLSPTGTNLQAIDFDPPPASMSYGPISLNPSSASTNPNFPSISPDQGGGNKWLVPVLVTLLLVMLAILAVLLLK
jgi:serine/threonine protein kinase